MLIALARCPPMLFGLALGLRARPPVPSSYLTGFASCPRSLAPPLLLLNMMLLFLLAVRDAANAVRIVARSAARSRRVCAPSPIPVSLVPLLPQGTGSLQQAYTELLVHHHSFHVRELPDVI